NVIPELRSLLASVTEIYAAHAASFPGQTLPAEYLALYSRTREFVAHEPDAFGGFDHFTFLRDYVNPLYAMNQSLVRAYAWASRNTNDYSLNNDCNSIFDKRLYSAQNIAGVYSLVEDTATVHAISEVGKTLFFDPILSGNGLRSCASCHHPAQCFTDTT